MCIGEFDRSFFCCVPGQSRVLSPFPGLGRPNGVQFHCRNIVVEQFCYVVFYRAGQDHSGRPRWLTEQYLSEWCRVPRFVYLLVVVYQRLHILVPNGPMVCDVMSEACNDRLVESFPVAVGVEVIGRCPQGLILKRRKD